jgi:hypothetical protein
MDKNPLLAHPQLGTIKPVLFNSPPAEKVFGYTPPRDPEGVREGEHAPPNPSSTCNVLLPSCCCHISVIQPLQPIATQSSAVWPALHTCVGQSMGPVCGLRCNAASLPQFCSFIVKPASLTHPCLSLVSQ